MVEFGKKVFGPTKYIPRAMLTESVPGAIYELHIKTKGVPDPQLAAKVITEKLYERFRAKVIWISIEGSDIRLQLVGSPFAWSLLLVFLPEILLAIGIIVLLISVYLVFAHIPGWVLGLAAIGAILFVGAPTISKIVTTRMIERGKEVG